MLRSTTGNTPGLEDLKWLAFGLMVLDHLARYAVPQLGPVPWLLGRTVFPLFAIALGVGLAFTRSHRDVFWRLVIWGAVAQVALQLAAPGTIKLNVLLTFACGLAVANAVASRHHIALRLPVIVGALVLAVACEFGPVGALLVAAAIWYGREHADKAKHWPSTAALVVGVVALTPVNGSAFGILALPIAWALLRWPVEVPRVRRLFYGGYVAQWCLVAAARVLL